MTYNHIVILKILNSLGLLESKFKKIYDSNNIKYQNYYKVASFIICTSNLKSFLYFCNRNNIKWNNGDRGVTFFNHLIKDGLISELNSVIIELHMCNNKIFMMYSVGANVNIYKKFPTAIFKNVIEI